jgi:hypothetical protein
VTRGALTLSWMHPFGCGAPFGLPLDVMGPVVGSIPQGLGESFSFAGVPAGCYTFQLRAANGGGAGPPSSGVALAFPNGCTGAPAAPENFLFFKIGSTVFRFWDPPASGPATTSYVLNVAGVGAFPLATRGLSSPVGPGSYSVSVVAVNACGVSPPTAVQTVTVP